jgi:F0F1-type ATP synthase membrane subunit b/b'
MKATNQTYVLEIKQILNNARKKAYSAVNTAMIEAYWLVGKRIVEEEQNGNKRANYGKEILVNLSKELLADLGKGYSVTNL